MFLREETNPADEAEPKESGPLASFRRVFREPRYRKEKRLEYFARDPGSVLLIDWNPVSEQLNPHNTIVVEKMADFRERRRKAIEAGEAPPVDSTCLAIKALLMRVREDGQAAGGVNVPRTLAKVRQEANTAGFSTDTHGLYQYLLYAAEQDAHLQMVRREHGLGGFVRRNIAASPVLQGKATTAEAAILRPFRDPSDELPPDSMLARKWRETFAKAFQQQPAMRA
jgi:hypothetical protein